MRIAIALSGQPRTWRHTLPGLTRFFGDHEVEVFLHTWDEGDPSELSALLQAYQPSAYTIEARPRFLEEKTALAERFPIAPPLTVFDMLYSVEASIALALEASSSGRAFDLVCRSRFDMAYDGTAPCLRLAADELLIPDLFRDGPGWTDQFALGSPSALAAYAAFAQWLPRHLDVLPAPRFRPEQALKIYLQSATALQVQLTPLAVALMRPSQIDRPFDALRDDPLFHATKHEDWQAFAQAHFSPSLQEQVNFDHSSQAALKLDRDLRQWLDRQPDTVRQMLLSAPWARRIEALDAFVGGQVGPEINPSAYAKVRFICAAMVHLMSGDEAMTCEGFVIHALSANRLDAEKAARWAAADIGRLEGLGAVLDRLVTFSRAFSFAEPLKQPTADLWRVA